MNLRFETLLYKWKTGALREPEAPPAPHILSYAIEKLRKRGTRRGKGASSALRKAIKVENWGTEGASALVNKK